MFCAQAELKWRLRTFYDRQEVNDVLKHLVVEGITRAICSDEEMVDGNTISDLDEDEEKEVYWFLSTKGRWFNAQPNLT